MSILHHEEAATEEASTSGRVLRVLRELGCESGQILLIHDLDRDLGIDSTEIVELGILVRREFGFEERAVSLAGARTVEDIVRRIDQHLSGRAS